MLNKNKMIITAFILIGTILIGVTGYKIYLDFFSNEDATTINRLDLYGYSLDTNDTEIYKAKFEELTSVLNSEEIDYEKYAQLLGELYIIDFYTLTNKISSTDIGGLEFVYPSATNDFKLKASDTVYKYVKINFDGKREQSLPEVSIVNVLETEDTVYSIGETEYDAYKIKYTWEYVEDLKYESASDLTIIKDGSKLYVVESD